MAKAKKKVIGTITDIDHPTGTVKLEAGPITIAEYVEPKFVTWPPNGVTAVGISAGETVEIKDGKAYPSGWKPAEIQEEEGDEETVFWPETGPGKPAAKKAAVDYLAWLNASIEAYKPAITSMFLPDYMDEPIFPKLKTPDFESTGYAHCEQCGPESGYDSEGKCMKCATPLKMGDDE